MKTKILAGVVLMTIATAGTLTYAASTAGTGNILKDTFRGMRQTGSGGLNGEHWGRMEGKGGFGMRGIGWFGAMTQLTDAEKTQLATMTDAQKKAFFQAKITEMKALRDTEEAVIDKLINGETLSDAEKATLATIKTERAALKAKQAARAAQIAELKPIMEKVKAGTTLTADEQAKLDAFKATVKQWGKRGWRGMGQ